MESRWARSDPLTRDALGDDYPRAAQEARADTIMITHDMTEATCSPDSRRGDARRAAAGRGHASGFPTVTILTSANSCAAAAAGGAAEDAGCRGMARHEISSPIRAGEALAHLRINLGNHVRVQRTALALGLLVSLRWLSSHAIADCPRRTAGLPSIVRRYRAWRYWRCSIRCAGARSSVVGLVRGWLFRVSDSSPRWLALALYSMLPVLRKHHHQPKRRRCRAARGRPRRRHDAAAVVIKSSCRWRCR